LNGFVSDAFRDNSQSSTDTASFSGSTQGSCPPSAEKVKLEPMEIVENGIFYSHLTSFFFLVHLRYWNNCCCSWYSLFIVFMALFL